MAPPTWSHVPRGTPAMCQVLVSGLDLMALLRYFAKSSLSLPTAKDTGLGEATTKEANTAVQRVLEQSMQGGNSTGRKRKIYTSFSDEQRAAIGRYAAEHSNAAAVKKFKGDFEHGLGESTVRLFKKKYLEELKRAKENAQAGKVPEVKKITAKIRGRPLLLGEFDSDVQMYIKALRKAGTPISVPVVLAAAEGVIMAKNRSILLKNGGHIELNRPWAVSILRRMGFVQRRGSTQTKASLSDQQILRMKYTYLSQISGMVKAHKIPPELIVNWDQAGVKLVPSQNWTMEQQGSSRVEIAGINDKRQITVTLAGSMSGELLPVQLLYQGKTNRCHPKFSFPDNFDVWHTPNHWANEDTTIRFIKHIILPYIQGVRTKNNTPNQAALVIFDVFKGHMGEGVHNLLEENKIFHVVVPNNCTDLFQPLDLSVNKPFKDKLRRGFSEWYSQEVAKHLSNGCRADDIHIDMRMSIVKELSCKWIMCAYDHIRSSSEIVQNGFKKAGITSAVENGVELSEYTPVVATEDPFNSDDDWSDDTDEHQH